MTVGKEILCSIDRKRSDNEGLIIGSLCSIQRNDRIRMIDLIQDERMNGTEKVIDRNYEQIDEKGRNMSNMKNS